MWKGDRLDWCLNWSTGCGKGAADTFCQKAGLQGAVKFAQASNIGGAQQTRLISTGAVCDQNFCDDFKFIECKKIAVCPEEEGRPAPAFPYPGAGV